MLVNEENTKGRPTESYKNVISQIAKDGVCPFCPEHLSKYHNKPIIEKEYWWVTDNMYPYQPTLNHGLLIHKNHIVHINEISVEAWAELKSIVAEMTKLRSVGGGTFILRFGDARFTGASVSHLHAHLIQSNPDDTSYDTVKGLQMRIG